MTTTIPYYNLVKSATTITSTNIKGAEFVTDLGSHWQTLYRSENGKYFLATECGGGGRNHVTGYLTREEAIAWIASKAEDAVTGYGYTQAQAGVMIDGTDAGSGYRDNDEC